MFHIYTYIYMNNLGGNENSRFIDLSKTPHENYLMLLLATNPGLKKSEEEEVAEVKKARAKLLRSGIIDFIYIYNIVVN